MIRRPLGLRSYGFDSGSHLCSGVCSSEDHGLKRPERAPASHASTFRPACSWRLRRCFHVSRGTSNLFSRRSEGCSPSLGARGVSGLAWDADTPPPLRSGYLRTRKRRVMPSPPSNTANGRPARLPSTRLDTRSYPVRLSSQRNGRGTAATLWSGDVGYRERTQRGSQ